ncbi:hypothetical protein [Saccharothrix saharensis]|uniref:hypothetical protein n=1 Tax=Saccharothrix saharensis TaxID=571190 RepID=UPI0011513E76|nr:hypothetical protein [Saccharothrix saharensis]
MDATDMFRAGLVQSVAAIDAYVHGVVLDYAVDILSGRRQAGSATQIGLHFGAVSDMIGAPTPTDLELRARVHVAERLGKETFQKPDDIGKAFAMVGVRKVWTLAFGQNAESMKSALSVAVGRRNQIVHSCDADPVNPGQVRPLSDVDALSVATSIEQIVRGLHVII